MSHCVAPTVNPSHQNQSCPGVKMSLVLFPLAILLLTRAAPASGDLASEYSQFAALDEEAKVKLYWTIDSSDGVIRFAVEAETTGWVGFGISSGQGKMEGADIVIGWVKDGQAYYSVRERSSFHKRLC